MSILPSLHGSGAILAGIHNDFKSLSLTRLNHLGRFMATHGMDMDSGSGDVFIRGNYLSPFVLLSLLTTSHLVF